MPKENRLENQRRASQFKMEFDREGIYKDLVSICDNEKGKFIIDKIVPAAFSVALAQQQSLYHQIRAAMNYEDIQPDTQELLKKWLDYLEGWMPNLPEK